MPSTVNKRRVVYILAKRVRSHAVSLKFLCILLNKGHAKQYHKSTMILQLMKSLYAHDVIDDLPLSGFFFGGCNFWGKNSSKSKIWYPVKL